jgi:POLQ-like helicase
MRPSEGARHAAAVTLSKGKMFEYSVPLEDHIKLPDGLDLAEQFPLAVGMLGDFSAEQVRRHLGFADEAEPTTTEDLRFAGRVLHAFVDARLNDDLAPDLLILASSAYYLCGRPGDAMVLFKRLADHPEAEGDELVSSVRWVLDKPWAWTLPELTSVRLTSLLNDLGLHFTDGSFDEIDRHVRELHEWAYASGDARQLLLADILGALVLTRVERSAWSLLPGYSGIQGDAWMPYLLRDDAVHEMWPSQRLLGEAGLYAGTSAVVQMPTSAGKTRATELVIRAAFLSGRSQLALVVAPFRALCQEIANSLQEALAPDGYQVNQLSDALQPDYLADLLGLLDPVDIAAFAASANVVVLTPEKLLYVLRQEPSLLERIGLIVYDEGHQFDNGGRGVTYELLLTSIKRLLPAAAQSVLISAVIRNAAELAQWLLASADRVVADNQLQTQRAVAFVSWPGAQVARLEFSRDPGIQQGYFVPKVIVAEGLKLRGRETKERIFPTRESGSVALYLALRLVPAGAVAVFCGTKLSAAKLVRDAAEEVYARGVSLPPPAVYSDAAEVAKMKSLYAVNFGEGSYLTASAGLGIFAHHGNTPHGLRLAVEHAMRASLIRLVVCTSTLAQGVNLPIRYLLITSTMQGGGSIRARDFHNLMGRAGRAGMHGEGTVIFTDPALYGERNSRIGLGARKWSEVQGLLAPESAEPTGSSLLKVLEPLRNDRGNDEIAKPGRFEVVDTLVRDRAKLYAAIAQLPEGLKARGFSTSSLSRQLDDKVSVLDAVESFLMAYREDTSSEAFYDKARELAKETLAFSLAVGEEQDWLLRIFDAVAHRVEGAVPSIETQARFGRSLLGLDTALAIDKWVVENALEVAGAADEVSMLERIWPLLVSLAPEKRLRDTEPSEALWALASGWIEGNTYQELHHALEAAKAKYPHGAGKRSFTMDMVVELCEQTFGFEFTLLLAALSESLSEAVEYNEEVQGEVKKTNLLLQKRQK